jgi:excisionase family DNA binding protein
MKTANENTAIRPADRPEDESTPDFEPLIDCRQASERVHCHEKTLQRYARDGRVPAYRIHSRWYFRISELDSWVRSQVNSERHPCRVN